MVAMTSNQERSIYDTNEERVPVRKVRPAGTTFPSVMKETLKYNSLAIIIA